MKIKRKYLEADYLLLGTLIGLLFAKLLLSYLSVENNYWVRDLPLNVDVRNPFNLPADIFSKVEYLIIPTLFLYLILNFRYFAKFKIALFIMFILFGLNLITALMTGVSLSRSINLTLKLITPVLFFMVLVSFHRKHGTDLRKVMLPISMLCVILAIIALMFFEISMNRIQEQWPIYFSGIHTHSYIMAAVFMGYAFLIYRKERLVNLLVFLFMAFLILSIGYSVRSALLVYLIFVIGLLYTRHPLFKYLWLQLLIFIPLVVAAVFIFLDIDFDSFSSGRLTMYSDKFKYLSDFSFSELLFGRGQGSDLVSTEKWWYDRKGSHSDFLTYIFENGILYTMLFSLFILSLLPRKRKINIVLLSILAGYFLSALISNGITVRPLAGYVFFSVFAFIYVSITEKNISIGDES